mmetsp:Transcript_1587/g.4421  ORF Transcript_1587/g.4421 Transcript_1587/m.4421 type:complete len:278 (+) Transcript_1587:287-1120(+)
MEVLVLEEKNVGVGGGVEVARHVLWPVEAVPTLVHPQKVRVGRRVRNVPELRLKLVKGAKGGARVPDHVDDAPPPLRAVRAEALRPVHIFKLCCTGLAADGSVLGRADRAGAPGLVALEHAPAWAAVERLARRAQLEVRHTPLRLGEREGVEFLVEQAQDQKARPVRPALREAREQHVVRPRRLARDLGHVDPSLGADAQRDERREGGHERGQAEALVGWVRLLLLHHIYCGRSKPTNFRTAALISVRFALCLQRRSASKGLSARRRACRAFRSRAI